jgi:alkylated DNA repair dioxygenase AlkB
VSASHTARQGELFADTPPYPGGLLYAADFITPAVEQWLIEAIRELPLLEARYKEYTARRRIVSYGSAYDFESNERLAAPSIPGFLLPLRDQVARWAGVPAERFVHALVSEYRGGATLGWHRDVPDFDIITGVSLGAASRMRFRPYPSGSRAPAAGARSAPGPFELDLEPRSAYVLRDAVRWGWQHSIPPADSLRYSVTFRTLRATARPPRAGTKRASVSSSAD